MGPYLVKKRPSGVTIRRAWAPGTAEAHARRRASKMRERRVELARADRRDDDLVDVDRLRKMVDTETTKLVVWHRDGSLISEVPVWPDEEGPSPAGGARCLTCGELMRRDFREGMCVPCDPQIPPIASPLYDTEDDTDA